MKKYTTSIVSYGAIYKYNINQLEKKNINPKKIKTKKIK